MKIQTTKLVALLMLMLFAINTKAQFLIGGSARVIDSKITISDFEQSNNQVVFSPQIGVALKPRHLLGFRYSYSTMKRESPTELVESTFNSYSIFSRHRKPLNDLLNVYGEISLNYINSQNQNSTLPMGTSFSRSDNSYGVSFAPGLEYKFAEKWLLNAQWGILSYQHTVDDSTPDAQKNNSFNASLQTDNIAIGISYLFNLKQEPSN